MELGIYSFGEATPDPESGRTISAHERVRRLLDEIELADKVGLDVYGLGEHHRREFTVSAPAVVLAAAATRTTRIRLTSAVSVISSDDPVRVFQTFATLDLVSGGRAEIMAGRGPFIESFPLFGYDLHDYDELFEEKLDLLLKIRAGERVTWRGTHRPPIEDLPVFPRPVQDPLPVWIAVGGHPESVVRAGRLGLPLALAIIGGEPRLDLCYEEDVVADVDMNVVCTGTGDFVEVQGTGEQAVFHRRELDALVDLGAAGCEQLADWQHAALST